MSLALRTTDLESGTPIIVRTILNGLKTDRRDEPHSLKAHLKANKYAEAILLFQLSFRKATNFCFSFKTKEEFLKQGI